MPAIFNYAARLVLLPALLFFMACKKEYPSYPYNAITAFSIRDPDGANLSASIDSNTIILYWPPLQSVPDSITPLISVSERAVIEPASGVKVPFRAGVTYTVTAQDGSVQRFVLKPAISQPPAAVYGITVISAGAYADQDITCRMDGVYFVPDTSRTAVYLVAKGGQQTRAVIQTPMNSSSLFFTVNVPDSGTYDVKLITGLQTIMADPLRIRLGAPELTFPVNATVQRGSTLTLNGKYLGNITTIVTYDANYNEFGPLTIVSQTSTSITVQIPADLPTGEYVDFSIIQNNDGNFIDFYVDSGSGFIVL